MDKINVIKISREFKDNVLGSIWLGREISIDDAADPIQAFIKANEELVNAYGKLSGGMNGGYGNIPIPDGYYKEITTGGEIPSVIPTIQVSKTDKAIQGIKEEIESCKDITTLETYRKIARTDETLKVSYYDTLSKLSTNQSNLTV